MLNIARRILSASRVLKSSLRTYDNVSGPPKFPMTTGDYVMGYGWCTLICIPPVIAVYLLPSWRDKDKIAEKELTEE